MSEHVARMARTGKGALIRATSDPDQVQYIYQFFASTRAKNFIIRTGISCCYIEKCNKPTPFSIPTQHIRFEPKSSHVLHHAPYRCNS
jgi:hypothetical protein